MRLVPWAILVVGRLTHKGAADDSHASCFSCLTCIACLAHSDR